jgi:hypothetical protein
LVIPNFNFNGKFLSFFILESTDSKINNTLYTFEDYKNLKSINFSINSNSPSGNIEMILDNDKNVLIYGNLPNSSYKSIQILT